MIKRLVYLVIVAAALVGLVSLFTYDIIKIDWISFMEIQSSYKPMEHPLPVPADSIPVDGAVYTLGMGVVVNPVTADDVSIGRGAELFRINCVPCHGKGGKGDGVVGNFFKFKPADLTSFDVQKISDEAIFLIISNGVAGRMPPLNENFNPRERWDLVNFIRTLSTPATSP